MRKTQDWSLRKNPNIGDRSHVEHTDFLGILKKEHVKIPGVN